MNTYRIYVAEDQPLQSELMRAALESQENYQCEFFFDGLELYRRVQVDPPELLVIDIILPSLSGLAVTRLLKFHDYYSKIPILVISSITEHDIKEQSMKAGADKFMAKPFQVHDLLDSIEELLTKTHS
ncbi:MAG: response regulator [Chloroflexi bacterium]|nr:response regulator [Chloroflexota bacterium]